MEVNIIYNDDCLVGMSKLPEDCIDIILTSPPYNTGRNGKNIDRYEKKYDVYMEKRNDDEYIDWTISIFNQFNRILKQNGVILYNLSYGNEHPSLMWKLIASIIDQTDFMIADNIIWKKNTALPNNMSKNKLSRICEYIFVICRKSEFKSFKANKKPKSYRKTGQPNYENIYNFIEAKNNDGSNKLNKATFSTELVSKLLDIYSEDEEDVILDPFMGTGTTALACSMKGRKYIGYEISASQVEYTHTRIQKSK